MAGRLLSDLRGEGGRGGASESIPLDTFSPEELVGRPGSAREGCLCSTVVNERWWPANGAGDLSREGIVVSNSGPNATRADLFGFRRGAVDPLVGCCEMCSMSVVGSL